ncbi:MAG TPA: alpha/beta fold hydrolase [Burkholderiales bacterium]
MEIGLAIVLALHALLYFGQERMIFFRQPLIPEVQAAVRKAVPDAEALSLATADGERLQGWFVKNGAGSAAQTLLYFGGNAEEVTGFALDAPELPGVSLALFNYRGYGGSSGDPGERALFADALAIYDYIASRPGVDPKRIVAMGRSLGAGVATYLASQRPVAAVVLVSPYDSFAALARTHYPFVLTGPLLKHPFDAASRARSIDTPMLALIAAEDSVIPPRHAEALVKAWRGPVTSKLIPGADHNDIHAHPDYWPSIRRFLNSGSGH